MDTWDTIIETENQKKIEDLKTLSAEGWMSQVKGIIHSLVFLGKPEDWKDQWETVFAKIKERNSIVPAPIDETDINMFFLTACGERREEIEKEKENSEEGQLKKGFIKNKTKGTYDLAEYLTKKYSIITVGEKEREMYVYQNGVYFRSENELIFPEIQRILGDQVNKSAKLEAFHKIADMTSKPRSIFTSTPLNFIPLANGVYDMEKKTILDQSPDYKFTYQFPIVYDKEADCPKTKDFLNQVLTPDQFLIIQEWLGYYFYRLYMFKKAIIFVGAGDTGKTTLLETIINLLGKDNISSVSLHKMASDKFAAAHLYGKHGNLVDELSAKDISDTGNFKIATGGGSISGEYKFGNQFSFQNFSKFTFACNKIPDVEDFDDEAYFGRWMIVRFGKTIDKKIPNFINTLTTEEERSGLFNFAMEGLDRLITQRGFSYNMTAMDIKSEMMKSGSSIAMFCSQALVENDGMEMSKEDMYEAYSAFCKRKGLATETMDLLGKKFLFYVKYATDGLITLTARGKRVRGWRNVAIVKGQTDLDNDKELDEFGE